MGKLPEVWKRPAYLPPETSLGDPRVIDVMLQFVTRRGCVIQAGAHVGLWPAVLSQHFRQVVSFEPVEVLRKAALEGAPYANVTIHPYALTSRTQQLFLSIPGAEKMARFSGSSTIVPDCDGGVEVVGGAAIDSLGLQDVGAVMLDIEGHELQALEGAVETIKAWHPVITVEENEKSLRHRPVRAIDLFLEPFGYTRVAKHQSDVIFARLE